MIPANILPSAPIETTLIDVGFNLAPVGAGCMVAAFVALVGIVLLLIAERRVGRTTAALRFRIGAAPSTRAAGHIADQAA